MHIRYVPFEKSFLPQTKTKNCDVDCILQINNTGYAVLCAHAHLFSIWLIQWQFQFPCVSLTSNTNGKSKYMPVSVIQSLASHNSMCFSSLYYLSLGTVETVLLVCCHLPLSYDKNEPQKTTSKLLGGYYYYYYYSICFNSIYEQFCL